MTNTAGGWTRRPLAKAPLGAIGEPTRSPSPFQTTAPQPPHQAKPQTTRHQSRPNFIRNKEVAAPNPATPTMKHQVRGLIR
jgi:hypothetical protein